MVVIVEPVSKQAMEKMLATVPSTRGDNPFSGVKEALEQFPAVHVRDLDGMSVKKARSRIRNLFPSRAITIRTLPDNTLLVHKREKKHGN